MELEKAYEQLRKWANTPKPPTQFEMTLFVGDLTPRQMVEVIGWLIGYIHGWKTSEG